MRPPKPVLVVGGIASGVGKTSLAVGIMGALRDLGLTVQAFKVGPDFIDPMHHEIATGRPSINLDGWMLTREQCLDAFHRHTADADIAVVEGVMGLFDGRDGTTEVGSTAQMAKWIGAPVILVVDCSALARSAAAVVKGYLAFDPALSLAGLLFNKVGGAAHTTWLTDAVAAAGLGVQVLGGIPKEESIALPERYLGLHMPGEVTMPPKLVANLAALVKTHVDLDAIVALAKTACPPELRTAVIACGKSQIDDGDDADKDMHEFEDAQEEASQDVSLPVSPIDTARSALSVLCDGGSITPLQAERAECSTAVSGENSHLASSVLQSNNLQHSQPTSLQIPSPNKSKQQPQQRQEAPQYAANAVQPADFSMRRDTSEVAELATPPSEQPARRRTELTNVTKLGSDDIPSSAFSNSSLSISPSCSGTMSSLLSSPGSVLTTTPTTGSVRIAIARDAAFCFYYHDNLTLLAQAGAELIYFSPLMDPLPPDIAGVYLGGGYPERYATELADNRLLRAGLQAFAAAGGVIYAECGGLLMLSQSLQPRGEPPQPMAGIFPFKAVLPRGKYTMGYVEIEATEQNPLFPAGLKARGHVHHASELVGEHHVGGVGDDPVGASSSTCNGSTAKEQNTTTSNAIERLPPSGSGGGAPAEQGWCSGYVVRPQIPGATDAAEGFSKGLVLASYVHLHFGGCPELAKMLVDRCRSVDVAAVSVAVLASAESATELEGSCISMTPRNARHLHGNDGDGHGLPAVRSSPEFHRPAVASNRARSVDFGRQGSVQYHSHPHGHPGMAPTSSLYLPPHPSQVNTARSACAYGQYSPSHGQLSRVYSYGSLSNHSGMTSGPGHPFASLHGIDRMSQLSESPLQLSPRTHVVTLETAMHHAAATGGPPYHAQPPPHHPHAIGASTATTAHYPHHHAQPDAVLPGGDGALHMANSHHQQALSSHSGSIPHALTQYSSNPAFPTHGPSCGVHTASIPPHQGRSANNAGSAFGPASVLHYPHLPLPPLVPPLPLPTKEHPLAEEIPVPAPPQHLQMLRFKHHDNLGKMGEGRMGPQSADLSGKGLVSRSGPASSDDRHVEVFQSGSETPHNWKHTFAHPPSDKIIAFGAGATEIAWALGLGNRVVAVSDGCDFPPEAAMRARASRKRLPAISTASSAPASAAASSDASPMKFGNDSSSNLAFLAASQAASLRSNSGTVCGAGAEAAMAGGGDGMPCIVDEKVIARERPGLVIYEEGNDEEPVRSAGMNTARPAHDDRNGFDATVGKRSGRGRWAQDSLPLGRAGACSNDVGRQVAEAVVSVGLQRACRVVALRSSTLGDVLAAMLTVGEAADVAEEASRAVDRLRARLRRVAGEAARAAEMSGAPRPRVLVLRSVQPFVAEALWTPDMITLAGGEPLATQPGEPMQELSWTEVVGMAPDVIVVAGLRDGSGAKVFLDLCVAAALPGWWSLPAVRSGTVFVVETALLRRAGPRLVDGTEALARMIHGDMATVCCPPRAVLKMSLRPGQRCRPRLLPSYFMAFT